VSAESLLAAEAPRGAPAMALDLVGVTKRFGGVTAVDGVTWSVEEGSAVGIIGPNGAGKSTLLKLIAGLLRPDQGRVCLFGQPLAGQPVHRIARLGVAMASQAPRPFRSLSVYDNVRAALFASQRRALGPVRSPKPDAQVRQVLERCGLQDKAATLPRSLGLLDLKRLEVARALALEPSVLLLDEVAAGLNGRDLDAVIALVADIHHQGTTVVVVEHIERVIRDLVDRVLVLDWGRVVTEGSPAEVAQNEDVRRVYLGVQKARAQETPTVASRPEPLVELVDVTARYGDVVAVSGVNLQVCEGEIVGVIGANGAGKSTLASVLSGLVPATAGTVRAFGQDITTLRTHLRARMGICHCPEGRHVFGNLTVAENLDVACGVRSRVHERLAAVYDLFPRLAERQRQVAGTLSGGEQQMLAIGRALMNEPKLLICDELTLGLAPMAIDAIYEGILRIAKAGVMVILIEQDVQRCLDAAHWVYVLLRGRVTYEGHPGKLFDDEYLDSVYFGREASND